MEKKTLKFRDYLIPLVLSGEKNVTWRLFDEKNLQRNDQIELINWNTGEVFAEAVLTDVREKTLGTLEDADWEGHERFESEESMYKHYQTYYKGENIGPDTKIKLVSFELK